MTNAQKRSERRAQTSEASAPHEAEIRNEHNDSDPDTVVLVVELVLEELLDGSNSAVVLQADPIGMSIAFVSKTNARIEKTHKRVTRGMHTVTNVAVERPSWLATKPYSTQVTGLRYSCRNRVEGLRRSTHTASYCSTCSADHGEGAESLRRGPGACCACHMGHAQGHSPARPTTLGSQACVHRHGIPFEFQ